MGKISLATLFLCTVGFSPLFAEPLVLTLETALERVLEANRKIEGASESVQRAGNSLDLVKLPFVTKIAPNAQVGMSAGGKGGTGPAYGAGVKITKQFALGPQVVINPNFSRLEKIYTSTANGSLVIPLIRGFGYDWNLSGVRSAEFSLRKSQRDYYIIQVKVVLETFKALYEVAKQRESMILAEEAYVRAQGFRKAAEMKRNIGIVDDLNVYRADIELKSAKEEYVKAYEKHLGAKDKLLDKLALPLDTDVRVDVPFEYQEIDLSEEEALEVAQRERVELYQSYDAVHDAERLARVAKKGIWPELNLEVKYNICGTGQNFIHSCSRSRVSEFKTGINTSTDLGRYAERIEYKQKRIGVASAYRTLEQTRTDVVAEVKKALRTLQRSLVSIDIQYDQVETAKRELRLAEMKFARGMGDNLDVIKAEKSLRKATNDFLSAVVDYIVGEYQLLASMGILLEKPECF